jgi:hypothetical protein
VGGVGGPAGFSGGATAKRLEDWDDVAVDQNVQHDVHHVPSCGTDMPAQIGVRSEPARRARCGGWDKASPKKSSPKTTLNMRTLYRESQKIPISSPRLASPIIIAAVGFTQEHQCAAKWFGEPPLGQGHCLGGWCTCSARPPLPRAAYGVASAVVLQARGHFVDASPLQRPRTRMTTIRMTSSWTPATCARDSNPQERYLGPDLTE